MDDTPIPIGPKSSAILADIGVVTLGDLRSLGVEETFRRAKQAYPAITLNFLWGLEAAESGVSWLHIEPARKRELRRAIEDLL